MVGWCLVVRRVCVSGVSRVSGVRVVVVSGLVRWLMWWWLVLWRLVVVGVFLIVGSVVGLWVSG